MPRYVTALATTERDEDMNDATQAYVNVAVMALEKIMGDEDDDSRNYALQLLGRRIMRYGWEADIDVLELARGDFGVPA